MDTLKKESKSMFSSETLDSMAMAEVYGGAAEVTVDMEMEGKLFGKCIRKCSCVPNTYCADAKCDATRCAPKCDGCGGVTIGVDTFAIGDVAIMATPVAMTAIAPVAADFVR